MKNNKTAIKKITNFATKIKLNIIKTAYRTNGKNAHIGGALSIVDILATLYGHILKISPNNFKNFLLNFFINHDP